MTEQPSNLPEVGPWARDKLDRLRKYLAAYTTVMRKQRWASGFVYVDAFAGPGQAIVRDKPRTPDEQPALDLGLDFREDLGVQAILNGSPRVALELEYPFTQYVFVERDPDRRTKLEALKREYEGRRRIVIRSGDCNQYLEEKLIRNPALDWRKWRAVVFLDPFGMHVPWATIEGLARTRAIEVFLNFPVGMAIQRLLKRSANLTPKTRSKLDAYFGDPGWHAQVYEQSPGLFGMIEMKAQDAAPRLVAWYRQRLQSAFGSVSGAYLIRNTRGGHLYYLVFAGPNKTGARIASQVLQSGTRT